MAEKTNKVKYSQEMIDYSKTLFDRQANDFDTLDNKALGIIGISGLLAGLQLFNIDTVTELLNCLAINGFRWLPLLALTGLTFHFLLLIACIIFALRTYQVREFNYPDDAKDLLDACENSAQLIENVVEAYTDASNDIGEINGEKAKDFKLSVWCVTLAIFLLVAFMVSMIFFKYRYAA